MQDQVRLNKTRSRLLVIGFAAVVAVVLVAIVALVGATGPVALVAVAVFVAVVTSAAYWAAEAMVLRVSGARQVDAGEHPRYHNLVEGLCTASGLPKPRLFVTEDPAPNALVTGRNPRNAAVVVTTGLLEGLNRVELEGVLAHELSHVKNYDIRPSTLAATMLAPVPLAGRLIGKIVSPERETVADLAAVRMTRYPPGLTHALEKLGEGGIPAVSTNRATAHLWLREPSAEREDPRTRSSLDHRVSLLREL